MSALKRTALSVGVFVVAFIVAQVAISVVFALAGMTPTPLALVVYSTCAASLYMRRRAKRRRAAAEQVVA